jgi:GMP synthase (glutamine-hydrolysing)
MRIHSLQQVPFEDLANIKVWAKGKGHEISRTMFFREEALPRLEELDWLIILGGPMNIDKKDDGIFVRSNGKRNLSPLAPLP